jgi:hypothetical protein
MKYFLNFQGILLAIIDILFIVCLLMGFKEIVLALVYINLFFGIIQFPTAIITIIVDKKYHKTPIYIYLICSVLALIGVKLNINDFEGPFWGFMIISYLLAHVHVITFKMCAK